MLILFSPSSSVSFAKYCCWILFVGVRWIVRGHSLSIKWLTLVHAFASNSIPNTSGSRSRDKIQKWGGEKGKECRLNLNWIVCIGGLWFNATKYSIFSVYSQLFRRSSKRQAIVEIGACVLFLTKKKVQLRFDRIDNRFRLDIHLVQF